MSELNDLIAKGVYGAVTLATDDLDRLATAAELIGRHDESVGSFSLRYDRAFTWAA